MTFLSQLTFKQLNHGALTGLLFVLSACGGSFNNPLTNLGGVDYGSATLAPTLGVTFLSPIPKVAGNKIGAAMTFTVSPALPTGLSLIATTGQIVGSASMAPAGQDYVVTAKFAGVEISSAVYIEVAGAAAPTSLTYSDTAPTYVSGTTITQNFPSSSGGTPTSYAIVDSGGTPSDTLCADTRTGMGTCISIDPVTGIISGVPSVASLASKAYTIRASNGGGFDDFVMNLTISSIAPPTSLSYLNLNASYPRNLLAVNAPTYSGGTPQLYAIVESGGSAGNTLCTDTGGTGTWPCTGGIGIDPSTGIISGTPSVSTMNTKVYKVRASNTGGFDEIDISINVISGTPSAFNYTIAASYPTGAAISLSPSTSDPASYSVTPALPTGLTLNTTTGVISGTPTVAGTNTTHTITKTNALGSITASPSPNFVITVPAPTGLSYQYNNQDYTVGTAITANTATITGTALTWTSTPTLPSGLSFAANGNIQGTPLIGGLTAPTALTPAASRLTFTVRATNAGGYVETTVTFSVVHAAPTAMAYANITGAAAGTAITAVSPTGMTGGAITNFTVTGSPSSLPLGLSLDASTGQITGSPTNPQSSITYTIRGTNSSGVAVTDTLDIQVNNAPPNTLAYLPNVGTSSANRCGANTFRHGDNVTFSPSNAGGPIVSYAIQSGTLPSGWTFDTNTGVITSGGALALTGPGYKVPATSPQIVVRGTNASGFTDSGAICIEVSPTAPTALSYTNNGPVTYTIGTAITNNSATPTAGLPNGSLTYSVTAPAAGWIALTGLTFDTATGLISGTPTGFGTPSGASAQTVTIQATNASMGGAATTRNISVTIRDRAAGAFSYSMAGSYNQYYSMSVAHGGHTAPATVSAVTYAITGCTLPAGITVNSSTGTVSGIPTAAGNVTGCAVRATSVGGLTTDSATFAINVVASAPDLRFVTTGQTPNPQASPTTTITPVATNVATTYSIRNAGSTASGAMTVTLDPDETTTPATEPGFFTITPSSGCAGSCVTDGGTGTTTCTGGASIVYGGQGAAFTGTCNLIVTSNFAGVGMTSGIKRAVITATGTSGTSAAVTIQTTATYAWVAQALYETATEAAYASVGALPPSCPSLGATTNVVAVDGTSAGGTQARMDRLSTNDGLCTSFAPRTQYYRLEGSIRPCGDTNPANQRTGTATGGTCKNPGTGDPNTIWTNYFTGTPELVDGAGPVAGCDTSRKFIVQVYRCQ